jgi:hypothetical protein
MTTATTTAQGKPMGYIIMSGCVGRVYTPLTHWKNSLVHIDTNLHNKIFAIESKLINSRRHVMEVERLVFNLPNNAIISQEVASILAANAADPAIA